ncbi:hypothetical protein Athai_06920 [Actinocatenispora thailandica]|uniref:GNAT family N-acetyltransferase n=1 Tax=Actinocatenispora thailandica TaxID=227318 RepID=A0A7R7DK75_9ACTN|nr:hypothetical protein [Actinocatenispora thailandica]BCJ33189.1 hypothetical protein Athai_06920 [Actinocatenispora thailandica]
MSLTDPAGFDPAPGAGTAGAPETIRAARPGDLGQITELLAAAFAPLAVADYLVPDPRRRLAVLTPYFRLFAEHVVYEPAATAHVAVDEDWGTIDAVALWLDSEDPGPPGYDKQRAVIAGDLADRFELVDDLLAGAAPGSWHERLLFLAVRPEQRHRGLGATLLAEHDPDLDALGTAGYLVAPDAVTASRYERHGYHRFGPPLLLPNNADLHPLVRDPR